MEEMLSEKQLIASRKQKIQFGMVNIISRTCYVMYWMFVLAATEHLLEEKQKVEEKLALLNEERELIDNHLDQQQKKFSEVFVLFLFYHKSININFN